MRHSKELVYKACGGIRPERTPIFDMFLNDSVIEHFAGQPLDGWNAIKNYKLRMKNYQKGIFEPK